MIKEGECIMGEVESEEQQQSNQLALPIDWHFPEGLQARYATNIVAQNGQFEIIISFFEAQLPLLLGQPEDNRARLEQLGVIRAECVSKIIVAAENLPTIIAVLQTASDNYRAAKALDQQKGERADE